MNKVAIMIAGMFLLAGTAMPIMATENAAPEPRAVPVFNAVYHTPSQVMGGNWDNSISGDNITVYADVSGADIVMIQYAFCNRETCQDSGGLVDMVHVAGTLWSFQLPGDTYYHLSHYQASANTLHYVDYAVYAEDSGSADWDYYPGYNPATFDPYLVKIYPAWPPMQINASAVPSKTTMWVGETFWINGTANYWNSTSYPKNYTNLLKADRCDVTVTVGANNFNGKTDPDGNYAILAAAPAADGQYTVNVTVSNATANRNVPCKAPEHQITVKSHWMNVSLEVNSTAALPSQFLLVNGTVELDGAPVGANYPVNVSIDGGQYWSANTLAGGVYSVQITTPDVIGTYRVNATVANSTYGVSAWNATDISVVAVPVPDLKIAAADIKVWGNPVQGRNLKLNATVFNMGIAPATETTINLTLDSAPLNSTKLTIAVGANTTVSVIWVAAPGIHYLNVTADPMNVTAESSETNNNAGIVFTVLADNDGDGIGDPNDPDDDDDGVNDTEDDFQFDEDEWVDSDGDGTGNNADTDDDGDGVPDTTDALPLDPAETVDTDGDGIGNNADTDDDGDGVPDSLDAFPLDDSETADADGDGTGNNADTDDDADGLDDATEDPSLWDTDNDGLINSLDSDDDEDGIQDATDTMPLDTDNDGQNNAADTEDDGDDVPDSQDAFPLDETESVDTDGDGIGNNADPDDDDDGVLDIDDDDPLDPEVGAPGGNSTVIIAVAVIAVLAVVGILVYMLVIKPKP